MKNLDLAVKNNGGSGSSNLDAIGLTAGGNAGGLSGLNLRNKGHKTDSAAGRLGHGSSGSGSAKNKAMPGLGLDQGGGASSVYAVGEKGEEEEEENDDEGGESEGLLAGERMPNNGKPKSDRMKAVYGECGAQRK